MSKSDQVYGIILAGGRSSRFGQDKGLYPWHGKPLIEHTRDILKPNFPNLAISTNNQEGYAYLGMPMIHDIFPGCGPVGGMFSALRYVIGMEQEGESSMERWGDVETRHALSPRGREGEGAKGRKGIAILSCDTPLVPSRLFDLLMKNLGNYDAIVPVHQGFKETTCAVYTAACLPYFELAIKERRYKILDALTGTNTLFLDVGSADFYRLEIFHNINYLEDL